MADGDAEVGDGGGGVAWLLFGGWAGQRLARGRAGARATSKKLPPAGPGIGPRQCPRAAKEKSNGI